MPSSIYSDLKMAWHVVKDGGITGAPKQAQVILSALCNQDCNFCAYRMTGYSSNEMFVGDAPVARYGHNNPKRWMPTERAVDLVFELKDAGVGAIQWTGGGEPTVHPDHEQIFNMAAEAGMKQALVSNGLSWSDPLIAILPRFSWVRVSVDAGCADTYARIRNTPAGNFTKVWGNIARLVNAVEMYKDMSPQTPPCVVGVGYVVTPDNYAEIVEGVRLASESGAAYIRLSAMFSQDGAKPYEAIYGEIRASIDQARAKYASDKFAIFDLFGERLDDLVDGPPDYKTCYYQHYNTYIGDDMNVYRCCVLAYNKKGLLGSIKDQPYEDFLASEFTQAKLKHFDARSCDRCQFNDRNRAMNYIMGDKPPHVEFP